MMAHHTPPPKSPTLHSTVAACRPPPSVTLRMQHGGCNSHPLITLSHGTGNKSFPLPRAFQPSSLRPWHLTRSAICLYRGRPCDTAPALQTASDTARIALAPKRLLSGVPSTSRRRSSTAICSRVSMPSTAGRSLSWMLSMAMVTLLPQ